MRVGVRDEADEMYREGSSTASERTAGANSLTAISLFSGAGGMDIGFRQAGFKVLAAVEIDPSCCDTLRANLDDTLVLNEDIGQLTGESLLKRVGLRKGELGLLFGGPPCQSFSLAGNRKGLDDPRGEMVGHFARLVHELAPRAFVMENVKGMVNWSNGKALDLVLTQLSEPVKLHGETSYYDCRMQVLNASDFGIPQHRERLFIVGNRAGKGFSFPAPTHAPPHKAADLKKKHVTVSEALGELPPAGAPSAVAQRVSQTIKGRIERHGY